MDASLRGRQPWQAAFEHDYGWLGNVITKHYHGDDNDVKVLMGGILHAFAGMTVDAYAMAAAEFLRGESAVVQSSPAETPTETSPCSTTPAGERVRACDCLVLHDDAEREFDYTAGAERSLERASGDGWTVISIKNDWKTVFANPGDASHQLN